MKRGTGAFLLSTALLSSCGGELAPPSAEMAQKSTVGACTAAGQQALNWARANYPAYPGRCLGMVGNAYRSAGIADACIASYSAKDALACARNQPGFRGWDGSCPCGAALFWPSSNASYYGHAAICNGDGTVVSTKVGSLSGTVSIGALSSILGPPGGYSTPAGFISPGGADLVGVKMNRTGSARTELHVLSRDSGYQRFSLQIASLLEEVWPSQFTFALGDLNRDGRDDLMAIKMNGTGSGRTEVHALSGAASFRGWLLQTGTLLETVSPNQFKFTSGDFNRDGVPDLVAVKMNNTGNGRMELHILSGAAGFRQWLLQVVTPQPAISDPSNWAFAMGDYDRDGIADLYVLKLANTGTGTTEVHILSGASRYQRWILQTGTLMRHTSTALYSYAVVDYNRDGAPDLMFVTQLFGTGTRRTEVHVLSGAASYRQWILETGTALEETTPSQFAFMAR